MFNIAQTEMPDDSHAVFYTPTDSVYSELVISSAPVCCRMCIYLFIHENIHVRKNFNLRTNIY